jgi:hypothetical protein
MAETQALALKDETVKAFTTLKQISKEATPYVFAATDNIEADIKVASAIVQMEKALKHPSVMGVIKSLAGNRVGFLTDKDSKGGYDDDTLANCCLEAMLKGLSLRGQEWNIIGGRCYVTKAGAWTVMLSYPGVTDVEVVPGKLRNVEGEHYITMLCTWKYGGVEDSIEREFPIKAPPSPSYELFVGKGTRKILVAAVEKITGKRGFIGEGELDDAGPGKRAVQNTAPSGVGSGNVRDKGAS